MPAREPDVEALRTRLARKFTTLADEVTECFEGFDVGGGGYVVELLAPEGVSTSGGKHALQHLRLRPRREGDAVIVVGSVNPLEKRAELRAYARVARVHERRGKRLDVTEAEWERLLERVEVVLRLANIETARVDPSPEGSRGAPGEERGRRLSPRGVLIFCVVAVSALLIAARLVQILVRGS
ncbi:MAG: hypothetical protein KF819_38215 [Labilithrix sp.]|nr:hypothetical protein [Labilithrix sp.]